jgi:hypothetical protein
MTLGDTHCTRGFLRHPVLESYVADAGVQRHGGLEHCRVAVQHRHRNVAGEVKSKRGVAAQKAVCDVVVRVVPAHSARRTRTSLPG